MPRRLHHALLHWIAAALVATISLSIGSGALHVAHSASHSVADSARAGAATAQGHDDRGHGCTDGRSSRCGHDHDHPADERGDDHDDCGTCVILAIAGGAPICAPAPIVFVTSASHVAETPEPLAPAPRPLTTLAARPPPTAIS